MGDDTMKSKKQMNTSSTGLQVDETKSVHICRPEDKVPLREQVLYGASDLFGGGQAAFLSVILLAFFTNVVGIEAAIASTIITVSKLWDAISDPSMGLISENTRWSKLGRRKPYMIIGGCLIPFALAFLFAPIQDASFSAVSKIVWMAFAYIVYCTVSTISQVPYMSMASDISMDYKERNKANTWKLLFDIIAGGLLYLIPALIWGQVSKGNMSYMQFYYVIVFGFGLLFGIPLIVGGLTIKERAPFDVNVKAKLSFKKYFEGLKVKSYIYHIIMYASAFLTMDMVSALAIYYTDYIGDHAHGALLFPGADGFFGKIAMGSMWVIMPMMVFAGIGILIAYILKAKYSKQAAFRTLMPLYIIGAICLACYNPAWGCPWLIPLFSAIMGIGFAGAQSMPWLIFPDTVDVAELKLGYRPTANMSGVMTFVRKAATAFGVGMVGWVLTGAGYVASIPGNKFEGTEEVFFAQPSSVLIAIRVLLAVSVTVLITTGFIASLKYKVTDKKLERIRYFNEKRNEVGVENFTFDELVEYNKLKKELC